MEFRKFNIFYRYEDKVDKSERTKIINVKLLIANNIKFLNLSAFISLMNTIETNFAVHNDFIENTEKIKTDYNIPDAFILNENEEDEFLSPKSLSLILNSSVHDNIKKFIFFEILKCGGYNFEKIKLELVCIFNDMWNILDSRFPTDTDKMCKEYLNTPKTFSLNEFSSIIYRLSILSPHIPWIKNYFEIFLNKKTLNFKSIDIYNNGLNQFNIDPMHIFRFIGIMQGNIKYTRKDTNQNINAKDIYFNMQYVPPKENPFNLMLKNEINNPYTINNNSLDVNEIKKVLKYISDDKNNCSNMLIKDDIEYKAMNFHKYIKIPSQLNLNPPSLELENREKLKNIMNSVIFFSEITNRQVYYTKNIVAKIHCDNTKKIKV